MCLLITQTSQSPVLSNEWLEDFYDFNSDGVGVMRAENGKLIIEKLLPKSAREFIDFYHSHIAGRDCAFHLRMRTHGEIDLDNCHPYPVLNFQEHGLDLWLMHNGILHTDNKADVKKSDTWHYIKNFLLPILAKNPDFAFTPEFSELIADHIGSSNKFVLMDSLGRMNVLNQDQGVYWAGLWLSNTYAWSASPNASKKPIKGVKMARKQAKEKPIVHTRPIMSSYSYPYNYDYDSEWLGEVRPATYKSAIEADLEYLLDEFFADGLDQASRVEVKQIKAFIKEFSENAFFDIAYMLIDKRITEELFVETIYDFDIARAQFAWLEDEVSA